jgi:small conductance mechanosensitive channel
VREIQIFHTILITKDGRKIVMPNGELSNSIIQNTTSEHHRRAEFVFHFSPLCDIDLIKKAVTSTFLEEKRILESENNTVSMTEINTQGMKFGIKVWCKTKDHRELMRDYPEILKRSFDKAGVIWPTQELHVHVAGDIDKVK